METSSFNLVYWEIDSNSLNQDARFETQMGITGGWIDDIPILQFKWRVMGYAETVVVLHLLVENNYVIQNLNYFDESQLKHLLIESRSKVNQELVRRTKETGHLYVTETPYDHSDAAILEYYREFKKALETKIR